MSRSDSNGTPGRLQATVHLHADTKEWLSAYASRLSLKESEVIRLLLAREQQIEWIAWATKIPDSSQPGRRRKLKAAQIPDYADELRAKAQSRKAKP